MREALTAIGLILVLMLWIVGIVVPTVQNMPADLAADACGVLLVPSAVLLAAFTYIIKRV